MTWARSEGKSAAVSGLMLRGNALHPRASYVGGDEECGCADGVGEPRACNRCMLLGLYPQHPGQCQAFRNMYWMLWIDWMMETTEEEKPLPQLIP